MYLSPHGQYDLEKYDPDDVYVIGAIVDKTDQTPYSLRKAKKEEVRCARFPLEQYVEWKNGTKYLCLNQVCNSITFLLNIVWLSTQNF